MVTTLVPAQDAARLFPGARKGDLVEFPFRSDRVRHVVDVSEGAVTLEDASP